MKCKNNCEKYIIAGVLCLGLAMFAFVGAKMICSGGFCGSKTDPTEKMAIETLRMKLGNPESLKILAVSKPDSVFQNRYCPEAEAIELSSIYLDYTMQLMDSTMSESFYEDYESEKMKRLSDASQSISILNDMLEREQGKFCGWRVRVKYELAEENQEKFESMAWFIFDPEKKLIYKTFDFPLL